VLSLYQIQPHASDASRATTSTATESPENAPSAANTAPTLQPTALANVAPVGYTILSKMATACLRLASIFLLIRSVQNSDLGQPHVSHAFQAITLTATESPETVPLAINTAPPSPPTALENVRDAGRDIVCHSGSARSDHAKTIPSVPWSVELYVSNATAVIISTATESREHAWPEINSAQTIQPTAAGDVVAVGRAILSKLETASSPRVLIFHATHSASNSHRVPQLPAFHVTKATS
jgi:hypothetical protein